MAAVYMYNTKYTAENYIWLSSIIEQSSGIMIRCDRMRLLSLKCLALIKCARGTIGIQVARGNASIKGL